MFIISIYYIIGIRVQKRLYKILSFCECGPCHTTNLNQNHFKMNSYVGLRNVWLSILRQASVQHQQHRWHAKKWLMFCHNCCFKTLFAPNESNSKNKIWNSSILLPFAVQNHTRARPKVVGEGLPFLKNFRGGWAGGSHKN